jgi:hypothetical protein
VSKVPVEPVERQRLRDVPVPIRFWAKVDRTDGCWYWRGHIIPLGYGQFGIGNRKLVRAHRYAYEQLIGPIPDGLELDHLCGVRHCVNPSHLEPVTHAENMRRSRKTHCKRGHELAGDNLYFTKRGDRGCRACRTERNAAR